jgi:hypothetical protein
MNSLFLSVFYMVEYALDMHGRLIERRFRFFEPFVNAFSHFFIHTSRVPGPQDLDHERYTDNSHRTRTGCDKAFTYIIHGFLACCVMQHIGLLFSPFFVHIF